jgi:hypothetical protein
LALKTGCDTLPPPLFSSPAVAHLLPPGPAQSAHRYLSIFATCPFLLLVHFRFLSVFSTSKLVRSGRFARSPPCTSSAQPTARRWRLARLPPPIRKSVNFRNRLLLLLPPTIATRPRLLPASCRRARGASFSRCETPSFLHYTAVVIPFNPSFNGLNRHSPLPPLLRPFNHPSPSLEPLSQPL